LIAPAGSSIFPGVARWLFLFTNVGSFAMRIINEEQKIVKNKRYGRVPVMGKNLRTAPRFLPIFFVGAGEQKNEN
jgi:hypothetical protein